MNRNTLLIILSAFLTLPFSAFAGWESKSFVFQGTNREYRVYTPAGFSASGSYSLVVGIHGLGDNMTNFSNSFPDFLEIADTANIVLVFPQGMSNLIGNGWNAGAGTLGVFPSEAYDDVAFINALTDTIQTDYPIIKEQTYLFGFSNGGFMVQRIACEANEKFAAIASLAGTLGSKITSCNPGRSVPILHFHGTADINVGYYANLFGINVDELMELWATNNTCLPVPDSIAVPDTKPDGFTVVHYKYNGCGEPVEYFKINDAAHILMNRTNNDISYSDEMWTFFRPKKLTLGIEQQNEQASVKLYPVPTAETVTIDLQSVKNYLALKLSVWDYSGKQIMLPYQNSADGLYHFDCSHLPNGIYLLKATDGQRIFSKKFTVAR